ncbi:MAG TPA: response regulator, partial [Labilithrix sp.]
VLVLVVTPDESLSENLGENLRRAGYGAIAASAVEPALECIRDARPDLVIVDFHLPNGAAWSVLRSVKATPATSAVPVIGLTTTALQSGDGVDRATDCDAWLPASCDADVFLEQVRRVLKAGMSTKPPPPS